MPDLYHPKGEMCLNCKNWANNCEFLNFSKMRPLGWYINLEGQKCIEVKCENFEREE